MAKAYLKITVETGKEREVREILMPTHCFFILFKTFQVSKINF